MVSPVAAPSAGLDTLPARPPTPPRERQSNPDAKLGLSQHPLTSRRTLQTPPSHSPDSAFSTNASSRRSRKKVEFTAEAEYCEPPSHADKENEHRLSTPLSALSSTGLLKPLKSILKPTTTPIPPNPLDPSAGHDESGNTTNLATMLESTIKQLAGNDRDSRVDAYTMLVRALKTSTNVPDRIALQSKMSLFMQFIQRDITTKSGNRPIDSSLVNHALTLLSTFLHFPAIATAVTSDFGVFIIDHCIRSFEDHTIPKDVVRHLMQVIVCQDFSSKVMTADRVGRLVISLHNIEDHIKGKSIIMSRILIYRRLIRQSAIHMVFHIEWLLDLFTDMLSSLKEIRTAAIALGLEASFTVAKETQLSKKVTEILQMSVDETRYIEYYIQRLVAMTKEKSEMAAVPQIWSVVVLLLRSPIDRWEFFDRWLEIIQRCFNSGDYQTKIEANYAWNRLVYSLHLHESSFSKTIGTLCQPFNQLKRRGKQPDELRRAVIGGLCNLYYYAFKPKSSSAHVDYYWDACVRTLIRTLAFPVADGKPAEKQHVSSIDNLSEAANILAGLFDSSSGRLWIEDRVAESPLAKPSELPPLDPKWIRRNTTRIFSAVEPILQKSFLELSDPESSGSKLWKSLIGAVAAAASKEVKVSTDTAGFLGTALSLLMKIWTSGLGDPTASTDTQRSFLKATEAYLTTMILSIGHLPFTEKLLSMNKHDTLVPVATPSHRSSKGHGPARSPLHHLFAILSLPPPGICDSEDMPNLFRAVFGPFMLPRSPRAKRDLAQELMQISSLNGPASYGPWVFIAETISVPWDPNRSSSPSADSVGQSPIGYEFRDIVKHLEKGISCNPNLPWPQWLLLFDFVNAQVTEFSGEVGCSVAVIEPLAKAILESWQIKESSMSPNLYNCCAQLVRCARHPRDRQALDFAKKRLWGTTVAGARSASFDPFDSLYRLTARLLEACYTNVDGMDEDVITSLLTETSHFLSRSNQVLVFKTLVHLQQGIGPWIQDANEQYGTKQRSTVTEAVKLLWDRICNLFSDTTLENFQLDAIEQLLSCAFKSKHRHIVNSVVLVWNRGFENANEVRCPDSLKNILLSLRPHVDIALPGLETGYDTNDSVPSFMDSQNDWDIMDSPRKPGRGAGSVLNPSSSSGNVETPRSGRISLFDLDKSGGPLSRSRSTRSAKRSKISKLRHDDSQIKFATIEESSPSNPSLESQVLTDRQKEVRERQLENAALFPSIRSSPQEEKEGPIPSPHPSVPQHFNMTQSPMVDRSTTPKVNRSYNYVSSTPTPRRGQPSVIDEDHEMTDDVPSSPPEPRRNLLPEMKSHSRDTRMLDDMPISSSPVFGSPVSKLASKAPGEQLVSQGDTVGITMESSLSKQTGLDNHHDTISAIPCALPADSDQDVAQSGSVAGVMNQQPETAAHSHPPKNQTPPKSDSDEFVDALTSPIAQGPHTFDNAAVPPNDDQQEFVEFKDRSFAMSDDEERSFARLVIELDSKNRVSSQDYDLALPEVAHREATMECVADDAGSHQEDNHSGESQGTQSLPFIAPTSPKADLPRSSKKSRKKRKRTLEMKQNMRGKRPRFEIQMNTDDRVMDSQVRPIDHEEPLPMLSTDSFEVDGIMEDKEPGDRCPSSLSRGSPDLACDPGDQSHMSPSYLDEDEDVAAVNLQLITEASQKSDAEDHEDLYNEDNPKSPVHNTAEFTDHRDETIDGKNKLESEQLGATGKSAAPPTELSAVDRITTSLYDALEGLRTATLSREDVYKMEDLFMDLKAELYGAEKRGRG
ncbi:hypothetical protein F4861DRAFT_494326 [Xylaria intraflava]|nr:hypothetical protein F4861DRAFT_494326 [Xylaria intraflava]